MNNNIMGNVEKTAAECFAPGDGTQYDFVLVDFGKYIALSITNFRISALFDKSVLSEGYLAREWDGANPFTVKAAACWLNQQGYDCQFKAPDIEQYGERDWRGELQ